MTRRHWFLPETPDVVGLLRRHLAVTIEGLQAFEAWAAGDEAAASAVRDCEHRADEAKREVQIALTVAFVTPLEPEDLFTLSYGIDRIMNESKDTVRESEVMRCPPDAAVAEMAGQLLEAVRDLDRAVAQIGSDAADATEAAHAAIKARRAAGARLPLGDGGARRRRRPARGDGAPRALPPLLAHRRGRRRRRRAGRVRAAEGELSAFEVTADRASGRRGALVRWVPGVALARTYRRASLRYDLLAGLVLAALLVPQGMAYAELAGLPAVTGLYATVVPLLVYVLLGPSRILMLGPDSAVSPLVAAAIVPLAGAGDPSQRIALAGMLALLVGGIMVAGGLARFGFVTELLSMPVRLGYLMGIAVTVIVVQLPKLFGFSVPTERMIPTLRDFFARLDETNLTALAIGLGSLAVILACQRWAPSVPGVFVAVVGATVAVSVLGLADEGVPVVGTISGGLPSPGVPDVSLSDLKTLVPAAVGIAVVAFTDTSVLSRSYAGRLKQEVDQNQELAVLGVANFAAGLFQGFPLSTSSSRTAVAENVGARTQVAGLAGAGLLVLVLLFGTGLLQDLPTATLAAIVIVAVLGFIDVRGALRLRRWRRSEFLLAMATFAGVAILGVLWGVGIAIVLSLLDFIRRAWRPHDAVLGRVEDLKGYHDLERHPDARRIPGLVFYRFDAPLFFANADYFREQVRAEARSGDVAWVVVAAEPITDVDATAGEMLLDLNAELEAQGIELAFAELKDPVRDRLRRYGLHDEIGHHRFFPTLGVAVATYVAESGVDWVDWEDRP